MTVTISYQCGIYYIIAKWFAIGLLFFLEMRFNWMFIILGLSLTKIAYYSTISYRKALYDDAEGLGNSGGRAYKVFEGNRLHFVKFETRYIENCLDFVKKNLVDVERFHGKSIKVTGGGAFKYTPLLQEKLGLL